MPEAEDERLGQLLRAIRRRSGQRQVDLAHAAGVPREDVIRVESGRAGDIGVDHVRRLFAASGGRLRITAWWNGAAADRLLDEGHAALVERVLQVLRRRGWATVVEATFSEYGERGAIDVLAGHPARHAIAVCEVKTALGSIEETNRTLDAKVRLAPRLATARFGWPPAMVGRVLILPATSTARRTVARHVMTMATVYPTRGRELRQWLWTPDRSIGGLWFVS
jgi:hypothetical protein